MTETTANASHGLHELHRNKTPAQPEPDSMAEILERQAARNVLRPAKLPKPVAWGRGGREGFFSEDQMREALDRADRAEKEQDEWKALSERQLGKILESAKVATTAEAALEGARKVIEQLVQCPALADGEASDPVWGCTETALADEAARRWLSANPAKEVKPRVKPLEPHDNWTADHLMTEIHRLMDLRDNTTRMIEDMAAKRSARLSALQEGAE